MIITRLMGGFGNQLFQYAAGRALALDRKEQLYLDLSFLNAVSKGYTKRNFELDQIKHKAQIASEKELKDFDVSGLISRALNRVGLKEYKVFYERGQNYQPEFEKLPENVLLNGYWQSEKYFSGIRKELEEEISPNYNFTELGRSMLEKISATHSIAIHVRRGDMLNLKSANDFHGICDISYYKKAIEKLKEKNSDLSYFVFSDDIKWCKEQFSFLDKVNFAEEEQGKPSSQDLFIMSRCQHNIIANSSYSWWSAWLNKNKGVVIAPQNWFKDKNAQTRDLFPETWIKL